MSLWETIAGILGADRYAAHAICLTNDPIIMTVYIASDGMTALSYFVIGASLAIHRTVIAQFSPTAIGMYAAFIFLCGLSHLTMTLTLFTGVYRLDIAVRAAMAAVSAVTAFYTALAVFFHEAPGGAKVQGTWCAR
ncbi:hypothetical protein [Methylobacterium oryzisoli]|uniref:hypothetical protein n=1 Tax=Methylobacterium oryzisoli TaxID=3385502 RepID=UPI0038917BF8